MKKEHWISLALLAAAVTAALIWPGGETAESQPAQHNNRNPRYVTVTADTGYFYDGIKLVGIYLDSSSLAGILAGQTLVYDTSGGRPKFIAGGAGSGSITIAGDATYAGITQLDLDTAQFDETQTIAGRVTISLPQNIGPWHSPTFYQITTQPGGAIRLYGPNGLKYTTFTAQNSAGNYITVPTATGTMVVSATSPLAIDPVTGIISFSGIVPFSGGGTNTNVTPAAGSVVWTDGSSYRYIAGGSGNFLRVGGSGSPTTYNLFADNNTWTGSQTISNRVSVDTLYIGTADIKKTWRGDGLMVYEIHMDATYAANDSIIYKGIPTGKTWSFSWGSFGKPPTNYIPGFEVRNDTLFVSSSHVGMEGTALTFNLYEQNN